MILQQVERALAHRGVTRNGLERVLVACSGGVDSVVLAFAVVEVLGARRTVLGHVDHGVRPGSADDAAFVEGFAAALGAAVVVDRLHLEVASEAAMRAARYQALEAQATEGECSLLLTAHTEDDQAETVLLGLLRATRLGALAGIPRNRGHILRPLLSVPRSEILSYARRHRLAFREDPSNLEPRYLRNRIRKELLPLLERMYRPGLKRRLSVLASEVAALRPGTPPGATLLGPEGPENAERVAGVGPGVSAARDRPAPVRSGGAITMSVLDWAGGPIPDGRSEALFDAELLPAPVLRQARPGDRIQPYGMEGRRKLADLFRENGVVPEDRFTWPVLAAPDGRVLWVPGIARSGDAPIVAKTKRAWIFRFEGAFELRDEAGRVSLEGTGSGDDDQSPGK